MDEQEKQDIMGAEQIASALAVLIESEKAEAEPGEEGQINNLEEALSRVRAFISAESKEEHTEVAPTSMAVPMAKSAVIDTGTLTGPMDNLKNFLIKRSRKNG